MSVSFQFFQIYLNFSAKNLQFQGPAISKVIKMKPSNLDEALLLPTKVNRKKLMKIATLFLLFEGFSKMPLYHKFVILGS